MAVTATAAEPQPVVSSSRGRRLPWRWTVALIAAELAASYVVLRRGGWTYDDNLYFAMSHTVPLGKFVDSDLFGHWTVGYKLVFWLLGKAMPFDYRWALVAMLLVLGASACLFARIVERLVGGRWIPTLGAGYFAISVLMISSLQWFSAGLQTIPTVACDLVCLWAYLRFQERRSVVWALVSGGSLAVGLLFYEIPGLMPVFLLALRLLVQSDDLRPRRIARIIWSERAAWAAYVVVLVAYTATRELVGAGSLSSSGSPSIAQWAKLYWLMWAKTLVPGIFGLALPSGSVGPGTVNGLQLAIGIVLQLAVCGMILVSIRRRSTAWRAWAALAVCIFVVGLVIGVGRFGLLGVGVATDPRYLVECAWLIPLFACLAFTARLPLSVAAPAGRGHAARSATPRRVAAGVTVLAVAYVSASVATAANWEDGWQGVAARSWEANVESGLAALRRHGPAVIVNAEAPGFVLQSGFHPYDFLSYILPQFGATPRVDGPVVGPLYTVTPAGRIRPVRIASTVLAPTPVPNCGRTGSAGIKVQARIARPLAASTAYYLLIDYSTPAPAKLPLFVDSRGGFGSPDDVVSLSPSAHQSIIWLVQSPPNTVLLSSAVGGYVCVRSVEVVRLGGAQ